MNKYQTVEEWLGKDNTLGIDIWTKKYQYNNESFPQWLERVSGGDSEVAELIEDKKFLFGGRILSNRGIEKYGEKITLSNCFVAGTKITTSRGLVNIEDVNKGDIVLTSDGTWQKVNEVMSRDYSGDMYKIQAKGLYEPIICTPNHKFLTQNGWKRADRLLGGENGGRINSPDKLKIPENTFSKQYDVIDLTEYFKSNDSKKISQTDDNKIIIETKMLNRGIECWAKHGHPVNRYIKPDKDFMYLIGRWLGDGSITKRKSSTVIHHSIIQIVFNKEKEEEDALYIASIGEKYFGFKPQIRYTNQNVIAVRWESEIIGSWFHGEFGEKCDGKYVPDKYLGDMNIALGLMDADGFISTHGAFKIVLKNLNLITWLRNTLFLNGFNTMPIGEVKRQPDTYMFAISSYIINQKLQPLMRKKSWDYRNGKSPQENTLDKDYIHIYQIDVLENQSTKVYNLSVENNHTYIANGVIVHNCYVITPPDDSIESIFECAKKLARTYSYGGGCGVDISKLAPRGARVNNAAKTTTGATSFMDLYSLVTGLICQNGRRGALMLSIDCHHPDLEEFIGIKSDLDKVTKANISVRITDDFMQAVKNHEDFTLSFTREETGETIEKVVNAYEMFKKFSEMNWDYAEPGMLFWDRISNYNLLSEDKEFSYAGTNPCAEEPLPAGGSCLLGSINLSEFVKTNNEFDFNNFTNTVRIAVRALNMVLDEGLPLHPLQEQRESVRDWRQIGLGIMGLADMLIKMEIKYGSPEAIEICDKIGFTMANTAIDESAMLAGKNDSYNKYKRCVMSSEYFIKNASDKTITNVDQYGLYNSQLLTIAPTGSLSSMIGVSGGIEPIYANYYERKTESLHGHDEYYKVYTPIVKEYMDKHNLKDDSELPEFFVTAQTLDYKERIEMQGIWQDHIDASISSTVNVPNNFTVEDVEDLYMKAWERGLKGITIFRDGCKRVGILSTSSHDDNDDKDSAITSMNDLPRGYIIKADDNCIGKKRTLITGCGTLHCEAFFDPTTGDLLETYFSKGSSGGCHNFMIGLSRMISLSARGGVDIYSIVDQLMSSGTCPSYAVRRATKRDTSKGSCCPVAIGNALIEMYEELQSELGLVEEKEVNVNPTSVQANGNKPKCPECGEPLIFEGGCNICKSCGWSKCD